MTALLVKLFIKDNENVADPKVRNSYGTLSGVVGIIANIILCSVKFFAGFITGSVSVMADALNNLADAASSVITVIGFKMAGKKPDTNHPFGHGRIEYLTGLLISAFIIVMGYELLKSSLEKIINPETPSYDIMSVIILFAAILVKVWLSFFNRKLGKKLSSEAMLATAADSLSDCISTGAVLVGAIIYMVFRLNVDGYIGALVSLLVLYAGFKAARDTVAPLLGQAPDPEFVAAIEKEVLSDEIVIGTHDMVIHDYGPGRCMISLHAEVSHTLDFLEAHDHIDNIENALRREYGCDVCIHLDPVIVDDPEINELREKVGEIVRSLDPAYMFHDLRIVRGETHTNVLFDVVVPSEHMEKEIMIEEKVSEAVHNIDSRYFAVIKVEQSYCKPI